MSGETRYALLTVAACFAYVLIGLLGRWMWDSARRSGRRR